MRIDLAFQTYTDNVSRAATVGELGASLSALAAIFDIEFVLIADVGRRPTSSAGLVYADEPREAEARFSAGTLAKWRPIIDAARGDEEPRSFSAIKAQLRADDAGWKALLPPWLSGAHGFATVSSNGDHAWYFEFAGPVQSSGLARSVLHMASQLAARWLEDMLRGISQHPALSQRETEALALIASGKSDAQAAAAMRITARTVRFHVDNAKKKLGVATRAQAIVQALRGSRDGRVLSSSAGPQKRARSA